MSKYEFWKSWKGQMILTILALGVLFVAGERISNATEVVPEGIPVNYKEFPEDYKLSCGKLVVTSMSNLTMTTAETVREFVYDGTPVFFSYAVERDPTGKNAHVTERVYALQTDSSGVTNWRQMTVTASNEERIEQIVDFTLAQAGGHDARHAHGECKRKYLELIFDQLKGAFSQ